MENKKQDLRKEYKMDKVARLFKAVRRSFSLSLKLSPWLTLSLVVIGIVSYLLPILQAKILGDVVDKIFNFFKIGAGSLPVTLIILYSSVWALGRIVSRVRELFDKRWGLYMEEGLEVLVARKRAEIDLGRYEDPEFQNLLNRAFDRSIWPVINLAGSQEHNISNIAVLAVASWVAASLDPKIYLIVLLTLLPSFFSQLKYGARKWHIWAENSPRQRKYSHLRSHVQNRVGITQLKLLQAKDKIIGMIQEILGSFRRDQLKVDTGRFLAMTFSDIVVSVGFAYSFFLIVRDVYVGAIPVGQMVFLIGVLGQLIGALNSFLSSIAEQYELSMFASDIFEVLDTEPSVQRAKNPKKLNLKVSPRIEFHNVWFQYGGQDSWVLKNINLTLEPNVRLALVGENGAGKTTLVKLLTRVYDPTRGEIFINGINLKELDIDEWHSYLAILLQDYRNYEFLVWESIAMGRSDEKMSRERAELSAQLASADDFINLWPNKFNQQIGREFEGGIDPSKGQSQKLAIARTIYRDGFVIVFDEPTASVDAKSEEKIFEQMEETASGKTLILISHRFNTVSKVDRILVLHDGEIVEDGPHKRLVALGGHYASMWHSQAKAYQETEEDEEGNEKIA